MRVRTKGRVCNFANCGAGTFIQASWVLISFHECFLNRAEGLGESSQQGCFAKLGWQFPHADCRKSAPGTRAVHRDQAPQTPLSKVATPWLAQPGLNGYVCSQPDEVGVQCISAVHMDTLPAPSAPTACLALRRGFTRVQLLLLQDRFNSLCFPRREGGCTLIRRPSCTSECIIFHPFTSSGVTRGAFPSSLRRFDCRLF